MMNGMKAFGAVAGVALLVSGCGSTGLFGGGADAAAVAAAAAGTPAAPGSAAAIVSSDPAVAAAQQKALSDAMTQQLVQRAILESFVPQTDAQLTSMQAAIRQAILNQALQQYQAGPVAVAPIPASVTTTSASSVFADGTSTPLVYVNEAPAAVAPVAAPAVVAPTTYGLGGLGVSLNAPSITVQ